MENFLSSSIITASFAGYNSLCWNVWSFRTCRTLAQTFLVFRVNIEIIVFSIFMCLDLFPLQHAIYCLHFVHFVFWLLCGIDSFFPGLVHCVFCMTFILWKPFLCFDLGFFCVVLLKILLCFSDLWFFILYLWFIWYHRVHAYSCSFVFNFLWLSDQSPQPCLQDLIYYLPFGLFSWCVFPLSFYFTEWIFHFKYCFSGLSAILY